MVNTGDNICLVVPPFENSTIIRDYAGGLGFEADSGYNLPPLGLMQLASCLEPQFKVSILDAPAEYLSTQEIITKLIVENTKLAILEFSVPSIATDIKCARQLAQKGIIVIAKINTNNVGILTPILKDQTISFCITGECEDIIVDVVTGQTRKGTAYLKNDNVIIDQKPLISDLDSLPFPKRYKKQLQLYSYPKLGRCTTVLSSKGCPYPCRYYCPYPLVQGTKWRSRTGANVIKELITLKEIGFRKFFFRDAVFTLSKERTENICKSMVKKKLNLEWWCETRADCLDHGLMDIMTKAGCQGINIGVESGDERLRFSILKPGVSNESLYNIASIGKQLNLKICFLFMIGFPGETKKSIVKTADIIRLCRPYDIGISFPVNYPDTQFDQDIREKGLTVLNELSASDGICPVIESSDFRAQEMTTCKEMLEKLFQNISSGNKTKEKKIYDELCLWSGTRK